MAVMRIQELREELHITQTELAGRMGVTQSMISEWEREVYLPKARDLPALSRVLGCSISELFRPDAVEDPTQLDGC